MSWDEVHEEAEHMEHAASERLIDRIEAFLGYPAVDPHGDPIPRADLLAHRTRGSPLSECPGGKTFRVVRVIDQDPAFLRYLSECGLDLHATGQVLENRPEAGAVVCGLGGRSVALGLSAAKKVLVQARGRSDPVTTGTCHLPYRAGGRRGTEPGPSAACRPRTRSATSSAVAGESCNPARLCPVATIRLR